MNMKKVAAMSLVLALIVGITACDDKKKQNQETGENWNESIQKLSGDSTIYGLCLDGSAMNTLQMVTDSGDTLTLSTTDLNEAGMVFGGYAVGDRMAVILDSETKSLRMIVNESTLMGSWVMLNPLDGTSYTGFCIKDGGNLESINQAQIDYKTWSLVDGQLEMVGVREGGGDFEDFEVYQLLYLSNDSLAIKDSETVYEYTRPGREDNYEDMDLELDESMDDDLAM